MLSVSLIFIISVSAVFFLFSSCLSKSMRNAQTESNSFSELKRDSIQSDWLNKFDLDGDFVNDNIFFEFTGGAHCCYKINIVLSSDKEERKFPFEMDGGYVFFVDNSIPEQFDIKDIDHDGLPEILMQIQTYNGRPEDIPSEWTKQYGIRSNKIIIEYSGGEIITRDYAP